MSDPGRHEYWRVVLRHRESFLAHRSLQEVYRHFAARMVRHLSSVEGRNVELGCGCGALTGFLPSGFEATDLYLHEWVHSLADACAMPFDPSSCANLVAVDVLHHLPDLARFFSQVERVLRPGGRLVVLEPYISPFSWLIYRFLHHEPVVLGADPFAPVSTRDPESGETCNAALPTLALVRGRREFEQRWPTLRIVVLEKSDMLIYPLTGGFTYATPFPAGLVGPLLRVEDKVVRWVGGLTALRLLAAVEKRPT